MFSCALALDVVRVYQCIRMVGYAIKLVPSVAETDVLVSDFSLRKHGIS